MNVDARTTPAQAPTQHAADQLEQMLAGIATTHSIYAVAKLGIANLLADGPRTTEELASLAAVDPLSLYRLLRALASVGVFAEIAPATFALTSIAERLPNVSRPTRLTRCGPGRSSPARSSSPAGAS